MKTNCQTKLPAFDGVAAAGPAVPTVGYEAGFPVRIVEKWRAAIASRVPVGFEDETGFHYGVPADDVILNFDSGGRSFFSAGFFTPTSLAAVARIDHPIRRGRRGLKALRRTPGQKAGRAGGMSPSSFRSSNPDWEAAGLI